MKETQLSNVMALPKYDKDTSQRIEDYISGMKQYISNKMAKSLYYTKPSFSCIVFSLVMAALAVEMYFVIYLLNDRNLFKVFPDFRYEGKMNEIYDWCTQHTIIFWIIGIVFVLIAMHGLCRFIYGLMMNISVKRLSKFGIQLKNNYEAAINERASAAASIENFQDQEVQEQSPINDKIEAVYENASFRDRISSIVVLVSRIALPLILFGFIIYVINDSTWAQFRIIVPFGVMILFLRRLNHLLEYKVNKLLHLATCIPVIVYGLLYYFGLKDVYADSWKFSDDINSVLDGTIGKLPNPILILTVLQVIVLMVLTLTQDYYSERDILRKSKGYKNFEALKNEKEEKQNAESVSVSVSEAVSGINKEILSEDTLDDTSDDSEDKSKKAVEIAEQIKVQNSIKAGKEMVFDEWKIYTSLFLHGLMIMCYIAGFVLFCETLGTSLKFWSKVGYGFLFGGIWRIISPVWPQGRPKKINRFLGMKYSIALSFVTITGIFTLFIASGCVITALMLELSVYVIVCSLLCLGGLSFFMG